MDKAVSVGERLIISAPDLSAITREPGGAILGTVKAVRSQNQAGKIAVFDSDMITEIVQGLENNQALKAMVDISGKRMDNAVFTQILKVINKQADGEKVVQVSIDLCTEAGDGKQWLAMHAGGLSQSLVHRSPYAHSNRGSPGSKGGDRE